ncbi:MAG: hypothetical protein AMXMBFR13_27760 [Phycisphaerae bacterium]
MGNYRLVAAQYATSEEEAAIELFFERAANPFRESTIILADDGLEVPEKLVEVADIA